MIALSNPKYDLYVNRFDRAYGDDKERLEALNKWGYLQDLVPRYFDGKMTVIDIADRHGLPFLDVLEYLKKWEAKGLVKLELEIVNRNTKTTS